MIRMNVHTRGGAALRSFLARKRGEVAAMPAGVTIGFHDQHIASLAAIHERGRAGVPARPAFAASKDAAVDATRKAVRRELFGVGTIDADAAQRIADVGAAELRAGYLRFSTAGRPPLSSRQRRRKASTPGRGKLLVGVRGPRLIEHISGRIILGI